MRSTKTKITVVTMIDTAGDDANFTRVFNGHVNRAKAKRAVIWAYVDQINRGSSEPVLTFADVADSSSFTVEHTTTYTLA